MLSFLTKTFLFFKRHNSSCLISLNIPLSRLLFNSITHYLIKNISVN